MAAAKPFEDALYDEIIARLKQDDSTVPYRKSGYWYSTRFEPGKEHPIFVRRKGALDAPEEILLDANVHGRGTRLLSHRRPGSLAGFGAWLAFCEDTTGRRQFTLRFKDLRSGEIARDGDPRRRSRPGVGQRQPHPAVCREGSRDAAGPVRQETCARTGPADATPWSSSKPTRASTPASPSPNPSASSSCTWKARCRPNGAMRDADDPAAALQGLPAARARS